jgi:hypothetical protein
MQSSTDRNPFRFGALALDDAFTDREAEVAELAADALNGQDVVIFAPRRYGKSSLVWRASRELVAAGVLVAHVNLMTTPTKEKLAEKLAQTIYEDIASVVDRVRERTLAPFRGLRLTPTITLDPNDGSVGFSFGVENRRDDIDATLERLLELPAELGGSRDRRTVLVMDEFQEVVEIDPVLPKLMRSVFERQPEVAHVYLGSKRHMMERIFNDENEPFWRSAKQVELGLIAPGPFTDYIDARFRATRRGVAAETIDGVLERTRGHPYATQELCYFLWEETAPGATAASDDLEAAIEAVLRSEHAHFSLLWDGASAVQRLVLEALADEPGHPFSQGYRARHRLPSASNVQKALRALTAREVVARVGQGSYRIAEPFLDDWVRAGIDAT